MPTCNFFDIKQWDVYFTLLAPLEQQDVQGIALVTKTLVGQKHKVNSPKKQKLKKVQLNECVSIAKTI